MKMEKKGPFWAENGGVSCRHREELSRKVCGDRV